MPDSAPYKNNPDDDIQIFNEICDNGLFFLRDFFHMQLSIAYEGYGTEERSGGSAESRTRIRSVYAGLSTCLFFLRKKLYQLDVAVVPDASTAELQV